MVQFGTMCIYIYIYLPYYICIDLCVFGMSANVHSANGVNKYNLKRGAISVLIIVELRCGINYLQYVWC